MLKFTLNTLGAPGWTLEETARNARAYGYAGVDLRLIDGEVISLDSVRANRARLRALFPPADLPIPVLATSVRLANPDPVVRRGSQDEVAHWIDLAADLGVPVVRVFGGVLPEGFDMQAAVHVVAECLAWIAPRAEAAGVAVGLETHDDFSSARNLAHVIAQVPSRGVGGVWDMYHTARMGEAPADVLSLVGERLLNVHLKDARRAGDTWELVLLGDGELPVKEALRLLEQRGYDGFVSVEWEKKWHPELAEPEVAFPHHMRVLQTYMSQLEAA